MAAHSEATTKTPDEALPVIIVGAGPCGLVAALTLQKQGTPFVLIEKASRQKLCSDAGAGFELAQTALDILKNRLDVPTEKVMLEYAGMCIQNMEGDTLRDCRVVVEKGRKKGMRFTLASVNRSDLQNLLLDQLQNEDQVLRCGVGLESYQEDTESRKVTVKLSDQSTIVGCALLGCDGIHSKVRKCMYGQEGGNNNDVDDPLNYCKVNCYWGKCSVPPGSDLEQEVMKTQSYHEEGTSALLGLGTHRSPGCFFLVPTNGRLLWAMMFQADNPPDATNDLTRRGGGSLAEVGKKKLMARVGNGYALLENVMEYTEAADITEVGLFDRKNLQVPYTSPGKLVGLLGDAAHPQTPFLGQGVNMAIADAYVYSTRIALALASKAADINESTVPDAIAKCDTAKRRMEASKIIEGARMYANQAVTSNRLIVWLARIFVKFLPLSSIISETQRFDKSNKEFVEALDKETTSK